MSKFRRFISATTDLSHPEQINILGIFSTFGEASLAITDQLGCIYEADDYDAEKEHYRYQDGNGKYATIVPTEVEIKKVWRIYIVSAYLIKYPLVEFATEEEAVRFCEENKYCWVDGNEFLWDLEIEEIEE